MVLPTPEQWALLNPVERFNFKLADFFNRGPGMKEMMAALSATVGKSWVEFSTNNLCPAHGFEKFAKIDPTRGVLLVANHRSFFDLFVVAGRLFTLYGNHHDIYFPVRSTFFYDHPFGQLLSIPLSCASMYPPVMRDKTRREFNRFITELMVELLQKPRTMMGFHPEGTRNRDPDPYSLLPGKVGCGELIHRARPNVVPVFLQGFPRYAWTSPLLNHDLLNPGTLWAHMVMGDPVDFKDELDMPAGIPTYQLIVDRVMREIRTLADQEKEIRQSWQNPRKDARSPLNPFASRASSRA